MTVISLAGWTSSPELIVGEKERQRMIVAALTDVGHTSDHTDFLLYELDRARVLPDSMLPPDVVRLGSIVRYRAGRGEEQVAKLVLPEQAGQPGTYRISVTSYEGAALLGLRPGSTMSWIDAGGATHRLHLISVANRPRGGGSGPGAA